MKTYTIYNVKAKKFKKSKKYLSKLLTQKGTTNPILFIFVFLFLLATATFTLFTNRSVSAPTPAPTAIPTLQQKTNLQMQTFYVTPVPTKAAICAAKDVDSMLVIDYSGTMRGDKLRKAQIAAKSYVDIMTSNPKNLIGVTAFSLDSTLLSPLTNNASVLYSAINSIPPGSYTCVQCGAKVANDEMKTHARVGIKRVQIVLSDGKANRVDSKEERESIAIQAAKDELLKGHNESGTIIYTVGFGFDVQEAFLKEVATATGGEYHFSPTDDEFEQIFVRIANSVCK